jgi:DNA-binding response OmpR family regulator
MATTDSRVAVNILYAEDDPASGRLVKSIASTEGYSVMVVPTGAEFLKALDDKPDLILLDLHLPDASGLDLLDRERAIRTCR